ncbi:MAG: MerR family transcriptional regulator [Sphingomonas sp. SCN 67-18]|uniref:MerR family transcriptional regulator n=1 Tax=uncultured Sphingomonas sp. TaxID=158754 RepID=UPI00086F807D|nr:MerR family transcriptional regulator [Sphingomonas sp. SCN 67-18]ODU20635.1 MAG: MerR family transcriptional regulator [Sphingomonas sp. SCN 67-18]
MTDGAEKSDGAFRTIGELSEDLGLPQHILRYWETRFPQLRPLQRAGKRRYYRPADVALVRRIDGLLNREGYTIKGVQKLLAGRAAGGAAPVASPPPLSSAPPAALIAELKRIRASLAVALAEDGRAL